MLHPGIMQEGSKLGFIEWKKEYVGQKDKSDKHCLSGNSDNSPNFCVGTCDTTDEAVAVAILPHYVQFVVLTIQMKNLWRETIICEANGNVENCLFLVWFVDKICAQNNLNMIGESAWGSTTTSFTIYSSSSVSRFTSTGFLSFKICQESKNGNEKIKQNINSCVIWQEVVLGSETNQRDTLSQPYTTWVLGMYCHAKSFCGFSYLWF